MRRWTILASLICVPVFMAYCATASTNGAATQDEKVDKDVLQRTDITVLTLPEGQAAYSIHGEFKTGQTATSKLLDGFTVDVAACFAAAKGDR